MTARVYYNTGFNAVNIPFSPEVLNSGVFDYDDVPALDILQPAEMTAIRSKIVEPRARNVDFLVLDNEFYYIVNGYEMTSADVATFYVSMVYLLTIGGTENVEITDGNIVRSHFLPGDEVGDVVDPLLVPSYEASRFATVIYTEAQAEEYQYGSRVNYYDESGLSTVEINDFGGSKGGIPFYVSNYSPRSADALAEIESPISLIKEGDNFVYSPNYQTQALKAGVLNTDGTTIGLHKYDGLTLSFSSVYPGPCFYDGSILSTARYLYAYGVPTPIEDSYIIPEGYVIVDKDGSGLYERILGRCMSCRFKASVSHIINNIFDDNTEQLPYTAPVYEAISNSAVKIKLTATGTGQSATVTPQNMQSKGTIQIDMIADPSPTGGPYFKIRDKINFDVSGSFSGAEVYGVLAGAVRGASWLRIPIVFSNQNYLRELLQFNIRDAAASASIINEYNRESKLIGDEYRRGTVKNLTNTSYDVLSSAINNKPAGVIDGFSNYLFNQESLGFQSNQAMFNAEYNREIGVNSRLQAAEEFAANNIVNEYETKFALTDSTALLTGNGAVVEVIYPERRDLDKYVEILQRYGFAQNRPAESYDIDPNYSDEFTYVQTAGLQLKGSSTGNQYPLRYYNMAAAELNGGVRLWKVKPDIALYKDKFKVEEGT